VHLLSMPGRPIEGEVVSVAGTLSEDDANPDMRHREIEVKLHELPDGLRPGMGGYAEVEVRRLEDSVILPRAAVQEGSVTVLTAAGPESRPVQVLASDELYAAIADGVREGEWVRLQPGE
jgi:hypothetical protein